MQDEDNAFRKIRLRVEEVQGRSCLTNFWGMSFTTDKIRSLVRKWQSLIEAHCDVKTTDGYMIRLFCIAFTKKRQGQVAKTCYAQVRATSLLPDLYTAGASCAARCCSSVLCGLLVDNEIRPLCSPPPGFQRSCHRRGAARACAAGAARRCGAPRCR